MHDIIYHSFAYEWTDISSNLKRRIFYDFDVVFRRGNQWKVENLYENLLFQIFSVILRHETNKMLFAIHRKRARTCNLTLKLVTDHEAGTKVKLDQLESLIGVGQTQINSGELGSKSSHPKHVETRKIKMDFYPKFCLKQTQSG